MPTKLADTRSLTLDDARNLFADIARLEIDISKRRAAAEKRIADLKANFDAEIQPQTVMRDRMAQDLSAFILSHPQLFERPRAIKTDFGRFGRRFVSNIDIRDRDALIQWALDNGHDDVIKTIRTPVKPAIAARIKGGEQIPGAALVEGEEAFYSVDRVLLDQATQQP